MNSSKATLAATNAGRRVIQVDERVPLGPGLALSLQHLFAMFGASVLVPILFNQAAHTTVVDPALVLLMNGVGTLIYTFICGGQAPAFLGSSFAFIAPTISCISLAATPMLGYRHALSGFIASGLIFAAIAMIIRVVGREWLNVILPPAAMGPIIALIGLELLPSAAKMAFYKDNLPDGRTTAIALITLGVVVFGSLVFRGFLSAIPVLIGVIVGYVSALILNHWAPGTVNFAPLAEAHIVALPHFAMPAWNWSAVLIVAPAALVVISEHVGHLFVTSNIVERDLLQKPGLHRSLLGDGLSTMLSGLCGSCPTTTYGENIGVMAITRVYSVWVIGGAGVISIVLAFFGKVSGLIHTIPAPVIGGVSLMLFGVIAASGLRMLIEAKVDYSKSRNLLLSAIVFGAGISGISFKIGLAEFRGMVLGTIVGIVASLLFWIMDKVGLTAEPEYRRKAKSLELNEAENRD